VTSQLFPSGKVARRKNTSTYLPTFCRLFMLFIQQFELMRALCPYPEN
jgi:hypothetical protein